MITTQAVDSDSISDFKQRLQDDDRVVHVTQKAGQRTLKVKVERDSGRAPKPWADWSDVELVDGEWHADDYVITKMAGGGHAPGNKFTHIVAISPYCVDCGDHRQARDNGLCRKCQYDSRMEGNQ
jgi:hypothetical protein